MKRHLCFKSMLAAICTAVLFCACDDKTDPVIDPVPPTPEALQNAYEYDGVKSDIASVVQERIDGADRVYLSPEKGITKAAELTGGGKEYVLVAFNDGIGTQTTDLTAAGVDVSYYGKGGKLVFEVSGTDRSAIAEGTLKGSKSGDDAAVFDFSLTQTSGAVFRGNFTASLTTEVPVVPKNRVSVDDQTTEMKSVFAETIDGSKIIYMTPAEGVTSFDQIMENDYDCFQVSVGPELLNESFDVMTETREFEIISMFEDPEFWIEPGSAEGIASGTCLFNIEGMQASLSVDIVLEDGRKVTAVGSCAIAPEPEMTEFIALNGVKKPVGTAFYELGDETVRLYFTPGEVESFDELPTTDYHLMLEIDPVLLDGTEHDIAAVQNEYFMIEYLNYLQESEITIGTGELDGASGTFSVRQDEEFEEAFTVEVHIAFGDGTKLDLKFDDVCIPAEEETLPNEYVFNGNANPINSVVVDTSNPDTYDIWFCGLRGITTIEEMQDYSPVVISCPSVCFDGRTAQFSDFPDDIAMYYGPFTYNAASGNTGTVTPLLGESELTLDFEALDAGGQTLLSGHYAGPVTIK